MIFLSLHPLYFLPYSTSSPDLTCLNHKHPLIQHTEKLYGAFPNIHCIPSVTVTKIFYHRLYILLLCFFPPYFVFSVFIFASSTRLGAPWSQEGDLLKFIFLIPRKRLGIDRNRWWMNEYWSYWFFVNLVLTYYISVPICWWLRNFLGEKWYKIVLLSAVSWLTNTIGIVWWKCFDTTTESL